MDAWDTNKTKGKHAISHRYNTTTRPYTVEQFVDDELMKALH